MKGGLLVRARVEKVKDLKHHQRSEGHRLRIMHVSGIFDETIRMRRLMTPSLRGRGGRFIRPGSAASTPSASAGALSVIRLGRMKSPQCQGTED
jgi:hypothetical protein